MIYTNMLFALGLDKVVFGQSPGWWSLGGSGLILGSAVFVAVRKGQVGSGAGGERGRGDVEMLGRSARGENAGSGGPEEEMAMLGGETDLDEEEEDTELQVPQQQGCRRNRA